jgi:hypothetical protein
MLRILIDPGHLLRLKPRWIHTPRSDSNPIGQGLRLTIQFSFSTIQHASSELVHIEGLVNLRKDFRALCFSAPGTSLGVGHGVMIFSILVLSRVTLCAGA